MRATIIRTVGGLLFVTGLGACAAAEDKSVLPPVVLGMLETTTPAYDDGQMQIYQVNKEVRLPFRRPKDGERAKGKQDVALLPLPNGARLSSASIAIRTSMRRRNCARRSAMPRTLAVCSVASALLLKPHATQRSTS